MISAETLSLPIFLPMPDVSGKGFLASGAAPASKPRMRKKDLDPES